MKLNKGKRDEEAFVEKKGKSDRKERLRTDDHWDEERLQLDCSMLLIYWVVKEFVVSASKEMLGHPPGEKEHSKDCMFQNSNLHGGQKSFTITNN